MWLTFPIRNFRIEELRAIDGSPVIHARSSAARDRC
jgi:hypothetical protein